MVLKLNSNRLGEECTFTLQRMVEKNTDLQRALMARGPSTSGGMMAGTTPEVTAAVPPTAQQLSEGVELFPCLQVCVQLPQPPPTSPSPSSSLTTTNRIANLKGSLHNLDGPSHQLCVHNDEPPPSRSSSWAATRWPPSPPFTLGT